MVEPEVGWYSIELPSESGSDLSRAILWQLWTIFAINCPCLGLTHFLSTVVVSMEKIVVSMEARYNCRSLHHQTKWFLNIIMHVIKAIQFPFIFALGYFIYIFRFDFIEFSGNTLIFYIKLSFELLSLITCCFSFKRQYGLIKFDRNEVCLKGISIFDWIFEMVTSWEFFLVFATE